MQFKSVPVHIFSVTMECLGASKAGETLWAPSSKLNWFLTQYYVEICILSALFPPLKNCRVLFVPWSRKDRRQDPGRIVAEFVNSLLSGLFKGLVLALFWVTQAQEVPKFFKVLCHLMDTSQEISSNSHFGWLRFVTSFMIPAALLNCCFSQILELVSNFNGSSHSL